MRATPSVAAHRGVQGFTDTCTTSEPVVLRRRRMGQEADHEQLRVCLQHLNVPSNATPPEDAAHPPLAEPTNKPSLCLFIIAPSPESSFLST